VREDMGARKAELARKIFTQWIRTRFDSISEK
jgi:hypothetical protein